MPGGIGDLTTMRERLQGQKGPAFWRSLEELAQSPQFEEMLVHEFPREATAMPDGPTRREFLKIMAASLALAGLNACTRQPGEEIIPYVKQPESIVPGKALYFATSLLLGGYARGALVRSHEGRPTKIEGNPDHPASLGATDPWMQAAILSLYDPDRSQAVISRATISTWSEFLSAMAGERNALASKHGAGLRILTGRITSPTLTAQMRELLVSLPEARWVWYEPVGRRVGEGIHHFDKADVVVSLDCDFLLADPASIRYGREFIERRRIRQESAAGRGMNRLYVLEPSPSITGAKADQRLPARPEQIRAAAAALARRLGIDDGGELGALASGSALEVWVNTAAGDLRQHAGRCLVLAGESQPAQVHALVRTINQTLGNVGQTVAYPASLQGEAPSEESLPEMVEAMRAGRVSMLVMLGVNPVYNAPNDLDFAQVMEQVALRVHQGLYQNETSRLCHWHVPGTHELEMWSDARAFDGTPSIIQPLIAPLYEGRSAHEIVAALSGNPALSGYEAVRNYWKGRVGEADFESWWRRAVHDGVIRQEPASTQPATPTTAPRRQISTRPARQVEPLPPGFEEVEILFKPDPTIFDGSDFAANGWLQELPKPITKLTWDNAALLSPATAARLGIENEDVILLWARGLLVEAAAWVVPGHADECITAPLGYGRQYTSRVADGRGFNAYRLRSAEALWETSGGWRKTDRRYSLASTQHHHTLAGRDIVREVSFEDFLRGATARAPDLAPGPEGAQQIQLPQYSLYPDYDYSNNHAWGMVIDLTACIGCNACVVACQAENNVPVVGKDQVARGREMHWIRIDRYYSGGQENPAIYFEPMLCVHCENAPCELVCPVAATVHSDEGLNQMVYNRCIGTRYCSNNCPYKVRRFNFLQYADKDKPALGLMWNPNVTVRSRGVMEKCTYCVQRIEAARIDAALENRPIADGEVVTACQGACPTEAIIFGDLNNRASRVRTARDQPHNFGVLDELNTRPRTTYLARVWNRPGVPERG